MRSKCVLKYEQPHVEPSMLFRAHKQTVEASAAFAEAGSVFRHFTATAALTPRESLSRKSIYGNGPMLPRYLRCAVEALNSKLDTSLKKRSGKACQPHVYFQWA
jgi:hypothetical protein